MIVKCLKDCTCNRHGKSACIPNCTCLRHKKCKENCKCNRHPIEHDIEKLKVKYIGLKTNYLTLR